MEAKSSFVFAFYSTWCKKVLSKRVSVSEAIIQASQIPKKKKKKKKRNRLNSKCDGVGKARGRGKGRSILICVCSLVSVSRFVSAT